MINIKMAFYISKMKTWHFKHVIKSKKNNIVLHKNIIELKITED